MLSHDPTLGTARTRLREALEHSAAGKFLRGARAAWADAWSHGRTLTKSEIRSLETQGNRSTDWNAVRILGKGSGAFLNDIQGCRFEGQNILDVGHGNPRLQNSLIRDCRIGAATVEAVLLLNRVIVEDGAVLRHLGECVGVPESRFCLGLAVHPGNETGARRVFLADGLLLEDCAAMAALPHAGQEALATEWKARLRHCISDHAYVGAGARIEHTRFVEDCYVGAGAVIRGAAALRHCVIGSSGHDPAFIGDNALVEHCVLEAGVRIDSAAQARRTLFLEHSGVEQGGHVADAVIGPNTIVAKGEVTASLVGPFVGFHHQALLIGTLWPEGRGNVGYGANVGSNHTGRKPDQELRPGEGTFFGLACAIKFPADFSDAPYSLFATGVVTPPQKIAFPFSLITEGSAAGTSEARNEILPGWMWSENAYALIRNAYKYADRNRARNHALPEIVPDPSSPLFGTFLASDVFAPRIAARVRKALAALNAIPSALPSDAVLTESAVPGLGKNFLRAAWIERARAAYSNYLAFVEIRDLLWETAPSKATKSAAKEVRGTIEIFEGLVKAVETSLRRDSDRGTRVFPDYADFHGAASEDAVCIRLKTELTALSPVLGQRLAAR
jgi:hypothetical protein